ncbi:hypothetical protein [Vreelandella populi]|uniref:hypothetical protein n=1 Tax=Vreelandella populi TaxID=2498858 RepID=UPI000F8E64DA|nr:hypothetical protein [Halomonas populi]RUR55834.1 hypothetical protein ELY40_05045 [Halomonas populi]
MNSHNKFEQLQYGAGESVQSDASIGQWLRYALNDNAGINASALHFYEQQALVQSSCNAVNQRCYKHYVILRHIFISTHRQSFPCHLQN